MAFLDRRLALYDLMNCVYRAMMTTKTEQRNSYSIGGKPTLFLHSNFCTKKIIDMTNEMDNIETVEQHHIRHTRSTVIKSMVGTSLLNRIFCIKWENRQDCLQKSFRFEMI